MDANSVINSVNVAREVSGYWLESETTGALITGLFIVAAAFFTSIYGPRCCRCYAYTAAVGWNV